LVEIDELVAEIEKLHAESFAWALACCRGDRQDAEDALQATYLKILDGRARFSGRSSPKTWLFAVIRKTAGSGWRRRAAAARLRDRVAAHGFASRGPAAQEARDPDPEEALDGTRQRTRLLAWLAELPERQRQVLELVFYHDLSLREAAHVLGITRGSASVHYDRAKRALRARLGEPDLKESDA
jgi:RNA polymerase sigma-70 factor (ECF subfamily)